jgi:hypothetical protein
MAEAPAKMDDPWHFATIRELDVAFRGATDEDILLCRLARALLTKIKRGRVVAVRMGSTNAAYARPTSLTRRNL